MQSLPDASFVEVGKLEPRVDNFHPGNQNIIADLIKNKKIAATINPAIVSFFRSMFSNAFMAVPYDPLVKSMTEALT